jgi:hypothetical protein
MSAQPEVWIAYSLYVDGEWINVTHEQWWAHCLHQDNS